MSEFYIQCIECGERYSVSEVVYTCRRCGDILDIEYNYDKIEGNFLKYGHKERELGVWRYRELLPILDYSKIVSLKEGGTRLYECKNIGSLFNLKNLYVKNEGENPTGSFKDRGMTVGVTRAKELSAQIVVCASTGNTSASLAAYAAKADMRCLVVVPHAKISLGKLVQAIAYGATVIQIKGNFDKALEIVRELAEKHSTLYLLNSVNPFRLEGQKTIAYEIYEQLGDVPDYVIVPIGNAGNISAIWKGFYELQLLGLVDKLPKMIGVQAEGASPIAEAIKAGKEKIEFIEEPDTIATAIRIGKPVNWKKALNAIRSSEGDVLTVNDEEIVDAQKLLARREGLFVEPASASPIAGLKRMVDEDVLDVDDKIVCIATGHGLKDPNIVMELYERPKEVEADLRSIEHLLGLSN